MRACRFEVRDLVIKARPYSLKKYIRFGGERKRVPIGLVGVVTDIGEYKDSYAVTVQFEGQHRPRNLDETELEPLVREKAGKLEYKKKQEEKHRAENPDPKDMEARREELVGILLGD